MLSQVYRALLLETSCICRDRLGSYRVVRSWLALAAAGSFAFYGFVRIMIGSYWL